MKAKRKEAAVLPTASTNNRLNESYRNSVSASRAKLQIGTLLLALQAPLSQNRQKEYWAQFDSMLRQYLDLKYCEVRL